MHTAASRSPVETWVESLFGPYLPARGTRRDRAIATLASDGQIWRTLHTPRPDRETERLIASLARLAAQTPRA